MRSGVYDLYIVINFVSAFELNCGILFIVSSDPGPNEIGRNILSFKANSLSGNVSFAIVQDGMIELLPKRRA